MNLALSIMIVLTVVWAVITIVGIVLFTIGLRGRRADFLPRCGQCKYVIKGGFDPTRCSECGVELSRAGMIRLGRRRIDETPLVFGLLLILIGISSVVFVSVRTRPIALAPVAAPLPGGQPGAAVATTPTPSINRYRAGSMAMRFRQKVGDYSAGDRAVQTGLLDRYVLASAPPHAAEQTLMSMHELPDESHQIAIDERGAQEPRHREAGGDVDAQEPSSGASSLVDASQHTWHAWSSEKTEVFSVDVASLEFELDPLLNNIFRVGRTTLNPAPSDLATTWSPGTKRENKPVDTRVSSTAVRPARLGRVRR